MRVIDTDQHIFERPDFWRAYVDPKKRDLALSIEPDAQGYWWLAAPAQGKRIWQAWVPQPEDGMAAMATQFQRYRRGEPPNLHYERDLPAEYWDPAARLTKLDAMGVDTAFLVPHWGLIWGNPVTGVQHLETVRANMEAENRRAVEIQQGGGGRLQGVGHLTLRGGDLGWFEDQVHKLALGGVRLAFMLSGLIDGRRWSHPDHERAWSLLADHGIAVVFHVQDNEARPSGLPDGWFDNDPDWFISAVEQPFVYLSQQVVFADMVMNGVLERHPRLRFCCLELCAGWLPDLARRLDDAYVHHVAVAGRHLCELKEPPGATLLRAVKVSPHWTRDNVPALAAEIGDNIMFGSDYPHCEGLGSLDRYRALVGPLPPAAEARLYGEVARELIS
jgi:predicted TIM-barrel fold metal-dependent hydrolase